MEIPLGCYDYEIGVLRIYVSLELSKSYRNLKAEDTHSKIIVVRTRRKP